MKRPVSISHLKTNKIHPELTSSDSLHPNMTKNSAASSSVTQGLKLTWTASAFYIKLSLISILTLGSLCAKEATNFILVLTDDQGWTSMSAPMDLRRPNSKSDYHKTPNMDALLERGMRFSNGYAAAPVCSPTRYSIQFGKSPARLNFTRVLGRNGADHNQIGIPQALKAADPEYFCAHLGKWHISADPKRYGYDVHDGKTTNREGGFTMKNHNREWGGYAEDDPKRVFSLTDRAIDFMQKSINEERPFFIQISHYAVHSDLVYNEDAFEEVGNWPAGEVHQNRAYAAMVHNLDESIGLLLEAYDAMGLAESTYLIFTSDNGGMPTLPIQVNKGEPYPAGLNSPLLRGKWDLTEGGIRVPFAVMGPGVKAGSQSNEPVISYDLLPTFADIAGATDVLPNNLDGRSIRPVLKNPDSKIQRPPEGLVFHFPHYNVVGLNEPHSAIRIGDYKLLKFTSSSRELLFNVADDPSESVDLYEANIALADKLNIELETYLDAVGAERPEDSNSWANGRSGATKTLFLSRYPK